MDSSKHVYSTPCLVSMRKRNKATAQRSHIEISDSDSSASESIRVVKQRRVVPRRSNMVAEYIGVSPTQYRRMKRWQIPPSFIQILAFLQVVWGATSFVDDCQEFMCGVGRIIRAFQLSSLQARGFDIVLNPDMGFLGISGFLIACLQARELKPGGLQHWDTVCSSWSWLGRKVTKRTLWCVSGDVGNEFVRSGNVMVARMLVLALFCLSKDCPFMLEQPASSLMRLYPRFAFLEYPIYSHYQTHNF